MNSQMKNLNEACEQYERAVKAVARYLELKEYEILDSDWNRQDGGIGIIAREDEEVVFVDIAIKLTNDGSFEEGTERAGMELLAAKWLEESELEGNFSIRFDQVSLIVMNEDRAFLRHHIRA